MSHKVQEVLYVFIQLSEGCSHHQQLHSKQVCVYNEPQEGDDFGVPQGACSGVYR